MFNLKFLAELRAEELERILPLFPPRAKVLEVGAGMGLQARLLAERGFEVTAIDLPNSSYASDRVFPVIDYDGRVIPLMDDSVDVIFSSNVLEHVEDVPALFAEFKRVLRSGGIGIHVMPTPSWRFWTLIAGYPTTIVALAKGIQQMISPSENGPFAAMRKNARIAVAALLPIGHGTSREAFSELWTFSSHWWCRTFARNGLKVTDHRPLGLFYTGHMLLEGLLSMSARTRLAPWLGSATRLYLVKS